MTVARVPALVVLVVLAVVAFLDRGVTPDTEASKVVAAPAAVSLSANTTELWFCAGPTVEVEGVDKTNVEVVSISDRPTNGRVTVVDSSGRIVERAFRIDAGGRLEVEPGRFVPGADFAALTVEVEGGAALVFQSLAGDGGVDRRPCPTRTDTSWLVPWSTTLRPGNRAWVLLHNPFRGAAVADLRFVGDIGRRETLDSQGVVIPGRSIVAYDLTERIADSSVVSATVDVRAGRLVTMRLQLSDGTSTGGHWGSDLAPGLAGGAKSWLVPGVAFADSVDGVGVALLNPGTEAVEVEILPLFADPTSFVEPWPVVLRAGQRHMVDLDDGRLAGRGEFGIAIRSLEGGHVAASVVRWRPDGSPGLDVRPASAVAARGWVVDLPERFESLDDVLAVANPISNGIATVEIKVLAGQAPEGLPVTVELAPGSQVAFPLGGGAPVVLAVESTAAVVTSVRFDELMGWSAAEAVAVAGTEELIGN